MGLLLIADEALLSWGGFAEVVLAVLGFCCFFVLVCGVFLLFFLSLLFSLALVLIVFDVFVLAVLVVLVLLVCLCCCFFVLACSRCSRCSRPFCFVFCSHFFFHAGGRGLLGGCGVDFLFWFQW